MRGEVVVRGFGGEGEGGKLLLQENIGKGRG